MHPVLHLYTSFIIADVAQLVEQRFCKAKVVGSSPTIGSEYIVDFLYIFV